MCCVMQDSWASARVRQEAEGARGKHGLEHFLWFLWVRLGSYAEQVQDWII